jgi:hypothetical protein
MLLGVSKDLMIYDLFILILKAVMFQVQVGLEKTIVEIAMGSNAPNSNKIISYPLDLVRCAHLIYPGKTRSR